MKNKKVRNSTSHPPIILLATFALQPHPVSSSVFLSTDPVTESALQTNIFPISFDIESRKNMAHHDKYQYNIPISQPLTAIKARVMCSLCDLII